MNTVYFGFTADQKSLREGLRELLTGACPPELVRAAWQSEDSWRKLWARLADIGLLGLLVPAEHGGMACTELEMVLLLEECGRFAVPGPLVEHIAVAVPALVEASTAAAGDATGGYGDVAKDLAAAAAGGQIVTAAEPGARHLRWARQCDLALLPVGGALRGVRGEALLLGGDRRSVDWSVPAASLTPQDVAELGAELPSADPAGAKLRGALGTAAQLLGLAAAMIDTTASYVQRREQFGAAIGAQQAVKHHMSNALIALEHARPLVYRAGYALVHREANRARDISAAKVYAYRAADRAGQVALQCHGAIAYTWEHDLHLWMKRVWSLRGCWGTPEEHQDRVAAALVGGLASDERAD